MAIVESEIATTGLLNTTAVTSRRGGDWTLNGKKSFVINSNNADLFLVLAGTKISDKVGDKVDSVTLFLIENDMKGVEIKESQDTLGCNGVQQCEVTFNNVELQQGEICYWFSNTESYFLSNLVIFAQHFLGLSSHIFTFIKICLNLSIVHGQM